jgi:hypothetical protein
MIGTNSGYWVLGREGVWLILSGVCSLNSNERGEEVGKGR